MKRITGWSNRDSDFLPGDFAVDLEQYPYYIDILYHQYDQLKFPVCSDHDRRIPNGKTEVFLNYMYKQAYGAGVYGYGMAIGVVVFLFSFILAAVVNKITDREVLEF